MTHTFEGWQIILLLAIGVISPRGFFLGMCGGMIAYQIWGMPA